MKRSVIALAGGFAGAAAYAAWIRPRHLRWGSSPRERERIWAGDEFMPNPVTRATRVVTVQAPAELVWPWVAQIGQDRGGFYTYTVLENAFRADMHNADRIHPEWQDRDPGDTVWLADASHYDGEARVVVARWIPGKAFVFVSPPDWDRICAGLPVEHGVWSILVEPVRDTSCRLIARTLTGKGQFSAGKLINYLFWEPAHFIMERGMLLGIKSRAEARVSRAPESTCCAAT